MLHVDKRLPFPVRVETPDPLLACALQQTIGGVEGEFCFEVPNLGRAREGSDAQAGQL